MDTEKFTIDTNTIKRNSNDFSFVDTLASFVNNYEFLRGYDEFSNGNNSSKAFIWKALSSIGNEYAETIYENVLNYIDNVSNVDLCKVKALQSMLKILGVKYDVVDTFSTFPIEIAQLMDIMSINKSYLFRSNIFKETFFEQLSAAGCFISSSVENGLKNEIVPSKYTLSSYTDYQLSSTLIDEEKYAEFLELVYKKVLDSFVYMKYADGEIGLPTTKTYIYEYLEADFSGNRQNVDSLKQSQHDEEINALKTRYNISKFFDQEKIVDDIENMMDSFDNYNIYEQKILQFEIDYRKDTYPYDKAYSRIEEEVLGQSVTRQSYYREKKVKEYFNFIENTYNNLIVQEDITKIVSDPSQSKVNVYDKDNNYFNIEQDTNNFLISYDEETETLNIQVEFIQAVAQALARQTLEIADIRESLKIQMQKNYMKGTFLLVSYIINEYLKYNISNRYGDLFYDQSNVSLKTILDKSITDGDNVQLIEYYDNTEYFNITTKNDLSALNSEDTNEKFWDAELNKIGVNTQDIPLEEIENFYKKQLKLERNSVSEITSFLSILFEYGANNSYINKIPKDTDLANTGDFVCQLQDGRQIGDPHSVISKIKDNIVSVNTIYDNVQTQIEYGYSLSSIPLSDQIEDLKVWVSAYYFDEISTANESLKESLYDEYEDNEEKLNQFSENLQSISDDYEALKVNEKYRYYISSYQEKDPAYFKEKLDNFYLSTQNGFIWRYVGLENNLNYLLKTYTDLSASLYDKLFKLSVWQDEDGKIGTGTQYWSYYSPQYDNEITTVTQDLKKYLVNQIDVNNENALQHIQNHYNALLNYKSEINRVLSECENAYAKLEAFKDGVESGTGHKLTQTLEHTWSVWGEPMYQTEVVPKIITNPDGSQYPVYEEKTASTIYAWTTTEDHVYSEGIDDSDNIETQLHKLQDRCNYYKYSLLDKKDKGALKRKGLDYDGEEYGFYPCTTVEQGKVSYKIVTQIKDNPNGTQTVVLNTTQEPYYYPKYEKFSQPFFAAEPESKTFLWKEYYSAVAEEDILNAFNKACEDLPNVVELINSELTCLGFNEIDSVDPTIDTVRDDTSEVYKKLVDRIELLNGYIQAGTEHNGWKALASESYDKNLIPFKLRINRISAINDIESKKYNIRYYETEFNKITLSVGQMLFEESDYFELYSHNDAARMDKQIREISNYMLKKDGENKNEVSSQLEDLSSRYTKELIDFLTFSYTFKRDEVDTINDDYSYNLSIILFQLPTDKEKEYLDYLLSGDYIYNPPWSEKLSGAIYWQKLAYDQFEESAKRKINDKVPTLPPYITSIYLLNLAKVKYLASVLGDKTFITDALLDVIDFYENDANYISSQISVYEQNKEIYLKYNGTDIGYDPFYNYKNTAYSSYQIHPYLYNFVEKSNIVYPLANNFFVAFSDKYEEELVSLGIDNIIGQSGQIINLWKYGMFDFTGYSSQYEIKINTDEANQSNYNPNIYYTGAFYPPALDAYLNDYETFLQNVQDDNEDSFYHHLRLSKAELEKIYNQLIEYKDAIREIVQAWEDISKTPSLSTEYDIYRYGIDANGNSLILYKSYKHLYEQNADISGYVPSFNEKKNTPGELWMRIKNHPLAFPAFDLRPSASDVAQYCIKEEKSIQGTKINQYLTQINETYLQLDDKTPEHKEIKELTLDTIGRMSRTPQGNHMRCFFDMEFDSTGKSLLLAVPYYSKNGQIFSVLQVTGNDSTGDIDIFSYANSSIIIGNLQVKFNSTDANPDNQYHIYTFSGDQVNTELIENISNPGMLYTNSIGGVSSSYPNNSNIKYEFIGFSKYSSYTYALFIKKYVDSCAFTRGTDIDRSSKEKPQITIQYKGYVNGSQTISKTVNSGTLKYDIFSYRRDDDVGTIGRRHYDPLEYKYANQVVITTSDDKLDIGFVTEKAFKPKDNKYVDLYTNTTNVVNFTEYTSVVEKKRDNSLYGTNKNYPRDTAILQTDDSQHINIYNSFDSFIQYLTTNEFKFIGHRLSFRESAFYNLNTDIGFMPLFADTTGETRLNKNTALSSQTEFNLELLGPENSDIKYTPVISVSTDESYGRVTEDYKEMNKYPALSPDLSIHGKMVGVQHIWDISSILNDSGKDVYQSLSGTDELLTYKYILQNTNYENLPIAYGNLSASTPYKYQYLSSEKYDLLSGYEVVGPNNITFQGTNMTNHINNISAISLSVQFNDDTLLPEKIIMSCLVRVVVNQEQVIPKEQFRLMIYRKNSLKSYDYYHLFENSSSSKEPKFSKAEQLSINFNKVQNQEMLSQLSVNGKYPFKDYSGQEVAKKMSADLEFKYSEEETINKEFPFLQQADINDEIVIMENDDKYIYFYTLDDYNSLSIDPFYMKRYFPNTRSYNDIHVNTRTSKYRDFYNKALRIETTYNLERDIDPSDPDKYGIVLYFNYKNYTSPAYVNFISSDPPKSTVESDDGLKNTYLVLKPGQNGRLDLRVDYLFYDKINKDDISYSVVGKKTDILKSYYILNVSDAKPKFIISKVPFQTDTKKLEDTGHYEMLDAYEKGMKFRFFKIMIYSNRGGNYISFSKVVFFDKKKNQDFEFPESATVTVQGLLDGSQGVPGCYAANLLDGSTDTKFLGRIESGNVVNLIFDMKSECLDIEKYTYWGWYNSNNSHSHESFMPMNFQIFFSNDNKKWYKANEYNDINKALPHTNSSLAYGRDRIPGEGLLVIE